MIAAVGMGWLLSFTTEAERLTLDVLTAFMAGFMIYRVFAGELPHRSAVRVRWFLLGVLVYAALDLVSGR